MTKFRTKKAHAFKGAAVLIIAALIALVFTGCQQKADTKSFKVTFAEKGQGGKLTAEVDGKGRTSPIKIEKDKTVIFKAKADAGYEVGNWKIEPSKCKFETGGTPGETTAALKVTEDVTVTVTFAVLGSGRGGTLPAPTPADKTYTIDGISFTSATGKLCVVRCKQR